MHNLKKDIWYPILKFTNRWMTLLRIRNHSLQWKTLFFIIFVVFSISCRTNRSLVNTAHIEHLYEEMKVDTSVLGTIWIYCEAPDFHKVADDDEGFTCVDDVARALVFYCREMKNKPSENIRHKIFTLTNFLRL